jgi:outer membrane protein TolC
VLYRPLKFIFIAVLGVLPAVLLRAQIPPLPATLPEDFLPGLRDILRSALQQSPQMITHDIDLAAQEANRYQQAAQEWPNLSGAIDYLDNQSKVSNSSANSTPSTATKGFYYNLSLNQPIYHWGALQAATDIAHLQIKISESQYASAYAQLATTIRLQYLSLIMQKIQIRNTRFALDQAKASFAAVQEKFKTKAVTQGELDDAKLAVDDASLAMDRTTEEFVHAKRLLLLVAGLAELSDDAVPEEIPKPVYPPAASAAFLQDFERDGLSKTFQAQVYDYQIRQSELTYKIAKYRLYPRIDLSAGISEQNQTQVVQNSTTGQSTVYQNPIFSQNVALAANWSIFDGFATRGAKLAALASKRTNERNLQTYLDQTIEQARYLERQVEFSARALALAEERFAGGDEGIKQAKDNLKLGTGSQAAVDQATAGFYQAQALVFSARIDFFWHWSDYVSLLGIDPVLNSLPAHFTSNAK